MLHLVFQPFNGSFVKVSLGTILQTGLSMTNMVKNAPALFTASHFPGAICRAQRTTSVTDSSRGTETLALTTTKLKNNHVCFLRSQL